MSITVTLARSKSASGLLSLSAGRCFKLDKRVGEPAELYLRGDKFATGLLWSLASTWREDTRDHPLGDRWNHAT